MKDTLWSSLSVLGAAIANLLGGWDKALEIMLIVIVIDYITGVGAAIKTKTLRSSTGYEGILKKGSMFLIVILAAQMDRIAGDGNVFRTCTAIFFTANDALSILENVGEMGVKLPHFMKDTLLKLRDENDVSSNADKKSKKSNKQ